MLLLLGFAFLAGLATILAPCVWPILPIILSTSVGKGKARPFGISLGVVISFAFFTLALSYLVKAFHIDANIFRYLAVVIIGFLGLSLIIPKLTEITEKLVSQLSSKWETTGQTQNSGFTGGFITGLSLGIVWSPCAGPILASIAALAATGQVTSSVILITLAYSIGAGVPLFVLSLGGQTLLLKSRGLSRFTPQIQKVFGVIMILTAVAILTNYDKVLSAALLNKFPLFSVASTGFESNQAVSEKLNQLKGQSSSQLKDQGEAPDFIGITKWLNTDDKIKIADLRGKVVLVDFWTYTCINCIRTLPHVTSWYDKYKDKGFVVIGVHTPEFEFEKDTKNVEAAIKQYNIHYPVAQDNNYATWTNYNNKFWPAEYLIDAKGNIRLTHFGEGEYDKTEQAIQDLLKEAGQKIDNKIDSTPDQTPKEQITPETYLGSLRSQPGSFSLTGNWTIQDGHILSGSNSTLELNFKAKKVFLVMRPPERSQAVVKVFLDGQVISQADSGADVKDGLVTIDSDRLYNLVDLKGELKSHILKLEFQTAGTKAFVFTFG